MKEKILIYGLNIVFLCWVVYFSCSENEQFILAATFVGKLVIALLPYIILFVILIYQKIK